MSRVLIVEDERIVALDLRAALEANGFVVVGTISRGDMVYDAAARLKPDILLMDVQLEGDVDGITAARAVRADLDLPIVFLTGSNDTATSRRIQDSGAQGYLIKPFDEGEVARILHEAMEQHAAQRTVRTQREELSSLVEAMVDAVITVDRLNAVSHLNPAAERLLGRRLDTVTGDQLGDLLTLHDGRDGPVVALNFTEDQSMARLWMSSAGAVPVRVSCSVHPLRSTDGRARGAVVVLQDLSTKRRMQESLVRADRMVTVRMMAGNMAHGINNPLQYVVPNVATAMRELRAGPLSAERASDLADLLDDALRGGHAIEKMARDLKLISTGDHRTQDAMDVRLVVQDTMRQLRQQVHWRGQLDLNLAATLPVRADPKALQQVVINLVQNAALALAGSKSAERWVRVQTGCLADEVFLEVEDNGVGIPRDVREHIFEPFFTTRSVGEGSGLGLAVVKQIVDDLNGSIEVWSVPGQGTRVRVSLPHQRESVLVLDDAVQPIDGARVRGRRVLVIDDDRLVRRALVSMLSRVHEVQSVASVDEALALIGTPCSFDAVLCDLMMSPRTGVEFVEALQIDKSDLVGRTGFITGGVVSGELQERVLRTRRPVVYKPIDGERLLRLVDKLAG